MIEFARRLVNLFRRSRVESGLDEEIRFHIDQQTEKNVRAGMTPSEARRRALVRFGGVEQVKEATRDEFRAAWLEDVGRDIRYGVRVLVRAPGFAVVSILTLALGVGAATAVFSVVNGVLLKPLAYPDPDRIVRLFQIDASGRRMQAASEPNFEDWKSSTHSFRAMAEMSPGPAPLVVRGQSAMVPGAGVSREFFDVMGVRPIIGRVFEDSEQRVGGTPAVVVSYRFWQNRLGAMSIDGQTMRAGDITYQVVGVMPPEFDYPAASEYWFPRELRPPQRARTAHNWQIIARLADGVPLSAAQAEISSLSRSLKTRYGDDTWMSDATAIPLREQLTATSKTTVLILFGAAVLLLAIACLNVSNLLLARVANRQREMAVRLAIGAGQWRIARQLLAEALVLCVGAGLTGLAIAFGGVRALIAMQPANLPRIDNVAVDWRVMGFALAASVVSAIMLTIAATLRTGDRNLKSELAESQRTSAGGRASQRVREMLSVSQVALTLVLLIGSGLLVRSFIRVLTVDTGYRIDNSLVLDLTMPSNPEGDEAIRRFHALQEQLLARIRALPGVSDVALVNAFPLGGAFYANGQFFEMTRPDEFTSYNDVRSLGEQAKQRAGLAGFRIASEYYFRAMGIPLIRGRVFNETDGPDAPHVAVISESLADTKWPNQDPLGRFIQFGNMDGDMRAFRIVGIVGDVREITPEATPGPLFYGYYRQRVASRFSVIIRGQPQQSIALAAQQIVRQLDPDVPVQTRHMDDAFDRSLAGRRFNLTLIGAFSVSALLLAMFGIYGLISYLVAQRTKEIGIRMALGASSRDLLRLILAKGAILACVGIVAGTVAALALTKLVEGLLYGVTARDPVAFVSVAAITLAAVLLASYLPARRALKVAPVESLRV
jgi:putative ABC transport system permease protein